MMRHLSLNQVLNSLLLNTNTPIAIYNFEVCIPDAPEAPGSLFPTNQQSNVPSNVTLSWGNAAPGISCQEGSILEYKVFLSQTSGNLPLVTTTPQTSYKPPQNLAEGKWYWQISVSNGVLESERTGIQLVTSHKLKFFFQLKGVSVYVSLFLCLCLFFHQLTTRTY